MKKTISIFLLLLFAVTALATDPQDVTENKYDRLPTGYNRTKMMNYIKYGQYTIYNKHLSTTVTNTTAAGDRAFSINISQATNALTGTLDGIYTRATGYGTNNTVGTIRGAEIGGRLPSSDGTKAAAVVTGGYFWADTKIGNAATLRGLEVSLDGGAGGTSTLASGIVIFNNSSAAQTTSVAVDINEGNPSGRKAFTYDMRMQNGETLNNYTNGTVELISGIFKHSYDAAAYWTATQADAGAVTFNSVSDGTAGFGFSDPITTTLATTTAGGTTGNYTYANHTTNALTGELVGVRGNARCDVASAAGTVMGGKFQAGNMAGGFNLGTATGVYVDVVNKDPTGGATTWTNARGFEVSMDLNQGTAGNVNTVTNAYMFYGVYNLPTVDTYATVTNGYGIFVRNEAVGGTGQMLDAAFYADDLNLSGGIKGWDYGLDFSGVAAGFGTADIKTSSGAKIFTGTAANGDAVYAEVGAKDATGSIYLSTTAGAIYVQVANAGAATDWFKVTSTDAD